jgi:hypothetical protein
MLVLLVLMNLLYEASLLQLWWLILTSAMSGFMVAIAQNDIQGIKKKDTIISTMRTSLHCGLLK